MCPGTVAYRLIDGVTEKDLWKICWQEGIVANRKTGLGGRDAYEYCTIAWQEIVLEPLKRREGE